MAPALRFVAPLLSGVFLLLSYPPYNVAWLAWIALVPLLWGVSYPPQFKMRWLLRDACLAGSVWGAGHFYPLLLVEGGTWLERVVGFIVITTLLIVFLFLFSVIFRGIVFPRSSDKFSVWRIVGVGFSTWIGLEYVFRTAAVGFSPYLGISQWQSSWLLHIASYGGVHAISGLLVIVNAVLFYIVQAVFVPVVTDSARVLYQLPPISKRQSASGPLFSLGTGLLLVAVLFTNGFFDVANPPGIPSLQSVADVPTADVSDMGETAGDARSDSDSWVAILVQPGFVPADYYEAAFQGWYGHERMFAQVMEQTTAALESYTEPYPAVVFWPETTVHVDVLALSRNRDAVAELAQRFGVGMVLGIPRFIEHQSQLTAGGRTPWSFLAGEPREHNSARVIIPDGHEIQIYDKIYVIPIAEAQYAPGEVIEPVYPLAGSGGLGPSVGIGICSDVIEPGHARKAVLAGAGTLHYLSALSRIGTLVELEKAFLVMRAAEHRVYVTQTATTGPTLVVDPSGRIIESVATAGPDVRFVQLPRSGPVLTFYTRWGDWPIIIGAVIFLALGIQGWVNLRRRS